MAKKPLQIGILETGRLTEQMQAAYGDYPQINRNWLAPFDAEFTTYGILDGEMPDNCNEADLWVITGSKHGAYENHSWMEPLEDFIRDCRETGSKMLGICFGHQIIAQALGGRVEKSNKGWGLGVHEYSVEQWPAALGAKPNGLALQTFHKDQVVEKPSEARRIASSNFCENAALWYPGFALTFQGHPEFSHAFANDLMEARRGVILTDDDIEKARATMGRESTRKDLALYIRDSFDNI